MITCLIVLDFSKEIGEVLLPEQYPADVPGVDGPEDLLLTEAHDPLPDIISINIITIITIIINILTSLLLGSSYIIIFNRISLYSSVSSL